MNYTPSFDSLLDKIETASDLEISQIIQAVIKRYHHVYPGWDVSFLALPKDPGERKTHLQAAIRQLSEDIDREIV